MFEAIVHCDMTFSLQYGNSPLMETLENGHVECVKALLDKGAEVNQQDKVRQDQSNVC